MRPLRESDVPAVRDLVVAAGMFAADEAGFLDDVLGPVARGEDDERTCVVDDAEVPGADGALTSVVLYGPEDAADRVWDLTMIAVRPGRQGRGHGAALLRHVEHDLRERGARLLLVDTSDTPGFERARGFYARCGYDEEARIRDFWEPGDDLVVFRKALVAASHAVGGRP